MRMFANPSVRNLISRHNYRVIHRGRASIAPVQSNKGMSIMPGFGGCIRRKFLDLHHFGFQIHNYIPASAPATDVNCHSRLLLDFQHVPMCPSGWLDYCSSMSAAPGCLSPVDSKGRRAHHSSGLPDRDVLPSDGRCVVPVCANR